MARGPLQVPCDEVIGTDPDGDQCDGTFTYEGDRFEWEGNCDKCDKNLSGGTGNWL